MKLLVIVLLSALALAGCTTSSELRGDDINTVEEASPGHQVQIVSQASSSEPLIEEEEETITVEFERPVVSSANEPMVIDGSSIGSPFGVNEEIEFIADDVQIQTIPEQSYQVREQPAQVYIDEDSIVDDDEGLVVEENMLTTEASATEADPSPELSNGFYYFANACDVRLTPEDSGQLVTRIKKGRRLWVEDHEGYWARIFRRSGPAYVNKSCLYHE